jgi:LmbE family N-acetylglucosaminyl deacetylase
MASVLVVAAHPDDEVLGCGGTIARHVRKGDAVHVVIAGEGLMARPGARRADLEDHKKAARQANEILGVKTLVLHDFPDNRFDSVDRLDITQFLETHVQAHAPEIVYTHHWADVNIDHRRVNECVLAACRPQPGGCVQRLLFFEVPSSTEWSGPQHAFAPNWFVDVTATLDLKIAALREYRSELRDFPHPRSIEAIGHLARWRGATAGMEAAEAFVLVRNLERDVSC